MTSGTATLDERVGESAEAAQSAPSLWEFARASGLQAVVAAASRNPNAKITALLVSPVSGRPVLAVKVPTTDEAARAIEREARVLADLEKRAPRAAATIPRVLNVIELDGRPGIVMTAVEGTPMTSSYLRWRATARPARVAEHFAAVEAWLAELASETAEDPAPLDMDGGVVSQLRTRFHDDEALGGDLARLAGIYAVLRGNAVPRTAIHGDLWLGNVLLTGERATGVIDWENGATSGEPVRDLARFALMYALFLDRRTRPGRRVAGHPGLRAAKWGAGVEYALTGTGWFPTLFQRFLRDGLTRLGASPTVWREAVLASVAEVAAFADDDDFARLHLRLFRRLVGPGRSS